MTFVDSGKGGVSREGGRRGEKKMVAAPIQAGRRRLIMSLCAKAFSFYTLNDDSHPSPSDNCIKTSCKHAKPSSLKYADTTNRKTDLKYIYIYLYIP
jgi:hypothetical protein